MIATLLGQVLPGWMDLPTKVVAVSYGTASWVLTALALGALGWSVRDALSASRSKVATAG